ncbi:MAG: hypothetical protein K5755_00125 [Clostridiales bacterium]|nr:hypothetical protein [Clostridiales bacterium]
MFKWGPYSKKYFGVSRITESDAQKGARFDFIASPAISNSDTRMPNVTLPVGWHPWSAAGDLSCYSYRVDLEWKDTVYADVSYCLLDDESVLVRTEIVNNSPLMQNCLVNYFSAIEYPFFYRTEAVLPDKSIFINAVDYKNYHYETRSPWNNHTCDGLRRGEIIGDEFVCHNAIGDNTEKQYRLKKYPPFGATKGDSISYAVNGIEKFSSPAVAARYRSVTDGDAVFSLNGKQVAFKKTDGFNIAYFDIDKTDSLEFVSLGTGGIELDFIAVIEKGETVSVVEKPYERKPEIKSAFCDNGNISSVKYEGVERPFVIRTFNKNTRLRQINSGCLEDCPTSRLSQADESFDNMLETFSGSFSEKLSDDGYYHNCIVHSVFIGSGESAVEYAVVSFGETDYKTPEEYERIYLAKKENEEKISLNTDGKKYEFSNELLKAAMLTNTVYPLYRQGEFIVHHTPGKRWDSFYSWDSGFIGLDMLFLNRENAEFILDTYLCDETNPDFAFLFHGSPVPVHIYEVFEMLNMSDDKAKALSYYGRAKHYYDFLAGKVRGSFTDKFLTGLTSTFDYFYNCSGMDDLPPQVEMYKRGIQDYTAPVISSSQLIRTAKLLKIMASLLNKTEDIKEYDRDISRLGKALNEYSWDEESGYFSYVIHNPDGSFKERMTTDKNENLNRTIDGIYPLVAGILTQEQKEKVLAHLKSGEQMMSNVGISAVDMTSSYYTDNGYWNGNVWFSHQWFIWKTMLDLGETDFAAQIAKTALDAWKKECEYSYYTFEMVNIKTGRGGWFHNFGGLSSPINLWSFAYYKKGVFNCGFDTLVKSRSFSPDFTEFSASLEYFGNNDKYSVIAVLDDKKDYEVFVNGKKKTDFVSRYGGEVEITLDGSEKNAEILIK